MIHEVRLGDKVKVGRGHTIEIYYVAVGRWAHELYVREDDNGLKVSRVISIYNRDIMMIGDVIQLKGDNLVEILTKGL